MRIWLEYTHDEGYLSHGNLERFLNDYADYRNKVGSFKQSLKFQTEILKIYSRKPNKVLDLQSFYSMFNVEKNYLSNFNLDLNDKLSDLEVFDIFNHYDLNKNKVLEMEELYAFIRDLSKHLNYVQTL